MAEINYDSEHALAAQLAEGRFGDEEVGCLRLMQPKFINYVAGESLTYSYPVLDIYANTRKTMQGGFISAAFDNTFGVLAFLNTKQIEMASIELSVNYVRPVFAGDELKVTAYLKAQGQNIIHLTGEAYNKKGKLIATATTNMMIIDLDK